MSAIRRSTYKDYDVSIQEKRFIIEYCKSKKADKHIIMDCAINANAEIADFLYKSLVQNRSYERLGWVPINKGDFYAYRRKMFHLLKLRLIESGDLIIIGGNVWSWYF